MIRAAIPFALALAFAPVCAADSGNDALLGRWFTDDKGAQVEIYKQNDGEGTERYFGKLVWFEDPVYEAGDPDAGKPVMDRENPDKTKRTTPLMNYVMLKDFRYEGENKWSGGTIYDPEIGKTYKCTITLVEESGIEGGKRLDVRGYIGIPAFGRTTAWTPVPADWKEPEKKDS